jgi:hypothetical protein
MQKRTKEEWLALIEECKKSKKLVTVFCRDKNIPKNSLLYWIHKQKALSKNASLTRSSFVELKDQNADGSGIEIRYKQLWIRLPISCNPSLLSYCLKTLKGER